MVNLNIFVKYVGNFIFVYGYIMDIWENMFLVRSSINVMCVVRFLIMLVICVSICLYI